MAHGPPMVEEVRVTVTLTYSLDARMPIEVQSQQVIDHLICLYDLNIEENPSVWEQENLGLVDIIHRNTEGEAEIYGNHNANQTHR